MSSYPSWFRVKKYNLVSYIESLFPRSSSEAANIPGAQPAVIMELLNSVFNHLVLPPQIPGSQDENIDEIGDEILRGLIVASRTASKHTTNAHWTNAYHDLGTSLEACLELNNGRLEKKSLLKHFQGMVPGQVLILHVVEQNAGLLIRREKQ